MTVLRSVGPIAFIVGALGIVGWGTLALHFAGPRGAIGFGLVTAWALGTLGILFLVRPFGRCVLAFALAFAVLLVWWSTIRPSNDRAWQADVARLPHADLDGDRLVIHDVRNFDYRSETDFVQRWETRTYDLAGLEGMDLFLSYWGSPWIAHTILSWSFADGQHLAISIETRKEVGEDYDPVAGFFRRYELYYVVADERDVIRLRTNYRGEQVYLYPLRTPRARARKILLDYVAAIDRLIDHPEFYNAATGNCTTTIRTHVQRIGVTMPFDWRLLVNGYIDRMLYEQGTIDTSSPFEEVRARSLIDAHAKAADQAPDFSRRIREGIVRPAPRPDPQ